MGKRRHRLEEVLRTLFPGKVAIVQADPGSVRGYVHPREAACVRHAVPRRRREFLAGRICARQALARFGISDVPLLIGAHREPLWPSGFVGSISHTNRLCVVVVARKTDYASLGLDVERIAALQRTPQHWLCTAAELAWLEALPAKRRRESLALVFSAKECLYKCQFPITRAWLDFREVEVTAGPGQGVFEARFLIDVGDVFRVGSCLRGRFGFCCGYVATSLCLPRTRAPSTGESLLRPADNNDVLSAGAQTV